MATKFTDAEKAQMDPNTRILAEINEAYDRGDKAAAAELRKQLEIPAEALMAAKLSMGAEWLRERGLRMETAERKYGKDWLDR